MDEQELLRHRTRFASTLDGRWATMGIASSDPAYSVWVFRGRTGHREAKGSLEPFSIVWVGPREAEITWRNGDSELLAYDFEIVSDTTLQIALVSRGRAVFSFESAPLTRLDAP